MKKLLLVIFLLVVAINSFSQDVVTACENFNTFNTTVFLKGHIPKAEAQKQFKVLLGAIHVAIVTSSEAQPPSKVWVFPLKGYKASAIGGTHGNGYTDKGYHYLDGNLHTAHPAHDIFISDKNQDDIDDKTAKPVDVLAIDAGYVMACTNQWDTNSTLKGGRFIWIYHPATGVLSYYAHNRAVFVKPGDRVEQGQKIAEVGRTGLNAFKKRSPTHLHFSTFKLIDYIPVPFNSYLQLTKANTR